VSSPKVAKSPHSLSTWTVILCDAVKEIHVIPDNDVHPHHQSIACWCEPRVTAPELGTLTTIRHYAADHRVCYEHLACWETVH
jgi:hypothetical protein